MGIPRLLPVVAMQPRSVMCHSGRCPKGCQVAQILLQDIQQHGTGAALDILIVVDMQVGLLNDEPKHDLENVIERINLLSEMVRGNGGWVIWIRHRGNAGDAFEQFTAGWEFLPKLVRHPEDIVVEKALNDPYVGTALGETLDQLTPRRVLVTGWATDFCVDATVRSTVSHDYHVVAVSDAHTLSDRPHLSATAVIAHHNWLWGDLITHRSVRVMTTRELLTEGASAPHV
jgi:nicotinamidase-related amidase